MASPNTVKVSSIVTGAFQGARTAFGLNVAGFYRGLGYFRQAANTDETILSRCSHLVEGASCAGAALVFTPPSIVAGAVIGAMQGGDNPPQSK